MEKINLDENIKYLNQIEDLISVDQITNFLSNNNIGLLIILDHIKAKDWPRKHHSLLNEPKIKIPLLWGIMFVTNQNELNVIFDIHSGKCFPQLYNKYNSNSKVAEIHIEKNELGYTMGGCLRNYVTISDNLYEISDLTPSYCQIFGLPDDCYDQQFEDRMIEEISKFENLNLWCFEKTRYIEEIINQHLKLNYMKGSFLPSTHFIYIDASHNFLKGIFSSKQLENINQELWYSSSDELLNEINLNEDDCYRFEEQALYHIEKKIIFEFIRQVLLLMNKNKLSTYELFRSPNLDTNKSSEVQLSIDQIINSLIGENNYYLNHILSLIENNIDLDSFKTSRFLVMDVEYLHILYPSKREGSFNFPCIFSNIIWSGSKEGFSTNINILNIPCHICKERCKTFMKDNLDFNCLYFGYEFIDSQDSFVEDLLGRYDNFKVYTYGKSDVFQLEQAINYFSNSFDYKRYERRNRKRRKRIIDVSNDLARLNKSLTETEEEILKEWLYGWSRKLNKVHVNQRFMIQFGSPRWEDAYIEAINSCLSDAVSALLLLFYEKYRKTDEKIKFIEPVTLTSFKNII